MTPLSVHCTLPVVTLRREGFSDETVDSRSMLSPQVTEGGVDETVTFVPHANSTPAVKLVPACMSNKILKVGPHFLFRQKVNCGLWWLGLLTTAQVGQGSAPLNNCLHLCARRTGMITQKVSHEQNHQVKAFESLRACFQQTKPVFMLCCICKGCSLQA